MCGRVRTRDLLIVWPLTTPRVPTQIEFSNSLGFPCLTANFPCSNLRDLQLSSFKNIFSLQISQYILPLDSGNLQQTKFLVFFLCFGKISKFPVFSLTGIFWGSFSVFPVFPVQPVPCTPLFGPTTMVCK